MKTVDLLQQDAETTIRMAEISKFIWKSKKTTVLTGAGISCNAGIPDFRSSDGLYNMVKKQHPQSVVKGQDLFDISLFRNPESLSVFCTFMEALYSSTLVAKPTETHKFIKILKDKRKLLRCYTQNIDGLEEVLNLNTGIKENDLADTNASAFVKSWKDLDVVQLHGDLRKLSCTHCFAQYSWSQEYQKILSQGENPECESCQSKYLERLYSGKRITGGVGMLRPSIVLYGENHPQAEFLARGLNNDIKMKPDLLIIMGTSLKVDGVKKMVKLLANSVHDKGGKIIFVNKTPLSNAWKDIIDYQILSDCDEFVKHVKQEIPDLFLTQEQLDSKKLSAKTPITMTPPTTPTKIKQRNQSVNKIKQEEGNKQNQGIVKSEFEAALVKIKKERKNLKVPTPELTPASSFDQPLRERTPSEINLNRSDSKRIKLEDSDIPMKKIKLES